MKKIPDPYLKDITNSVTKINEYLAEIKHNKLIFWQDTEKQDAVIRRLEIIGEATKRLEIDFKNDFPEIPWREMAGMRDVLIHNYDEIDLELVWEVIEKDLPELEKAIASI